MTIVLGGSGHGGAPFVGDCVVVEVRVLRPTAQSLQGVKDERQGEGHEVVVVWIWLWEAKHSVPPCEETDYVQSIRRRCHPINHNNASA